MGNFTTHLLHALEKMEKDIHSARCKMGDQQMEVITLGSTKMGTQITKTQMRHRMMCRYGHFIQDRQAKT
jgi:hypothetical protein